MLEIHLPNLRFSPCSSRYSTLPSLSLKLQSTLDEFYYSGVKSTSKDRQASSKDRQWIILLICLEVTAHFLECFDPGGQILQDLKVTFRFLFWSFFWGMSVSRCVFGGPRRCQRRWITLSYRQLISRFTCCVHPRSQREERAKRRCNHSSSEDSAKVITTAKTIGDSFSSGFVSVAVTTFLASFDPLTRYHQLIDWHCDTKSLGALKVVLYAAASPPFALFANRCQRDHSHAT
jgi:hypothetical protein